MTVIRPFLSAAFDFGFCISVNKQLASAYNHTISLVCYFFNYVMLCC